MLNSMLFCFFEDYQNSITPRWDPNLALEDVVIPMGLPLAPYLACMCITYLLRDYHSPPNRSLTINFDDVAAT